MRGGWSQEKGSLDFQADNGHREMDLFQEGRLLFPIALSGSFIGACKKKKTKTDKDNDAAKRGLSAATVVALVAPAMRSHSDQEKMSCEVSSRVGISLTLQARHLYQTINFNEPGES